MPKRRKSKANKARDCADEVGRRWAEACFAQPGRPEPVKQGALLQQKVCAERWNELTGRYPSWYTYLAQRDGKWWVVNAGQGLDCGPYETKMEAESDARGLRNFDKYQNVKGYMTTDARRRT